MGGVIKYKKRDEPVEEHQVERRWCKRDRDRSTWWRHRKERAQLKRCCAAEEGDDGGKARGIRPLQLATASFNFVFCCLWYVVPLQERRREYYYLWNNRVFVFVKCYVFIYKREGHQKRLCFFMMRWQPGNADIGFFSFSNASLFFSRVPLRFNYFGFTINK